jgi:hypothetical protein
MFIWSYLRWTIPKGYTTTRLNLGFFCAVNLRIRNQISLYQFHFLNKEARDVGRPPLPLFLLQKSLTLDQPLVQLFLRAAEWQPELRVLTHHSLVQT